jgi:transcription-repair coupling factor (superfamily II helicase)
MPSGVDQLLHVLDHSPLLRQWVERVRAGGPILIEGLWETPKAVLATLLHRHLQRPILWIGGEQSEAKVFEDLRTLSCAPICEIPAWETLPSENVAPSPDLVGTRMRALSQLLQDNSAAVVLCPLQSALQRVLPPKTMQRLCWKFQVGEELGFERLHQRLEEMGYRRVSVVSDKGEYALRGGIVDLFPVGEPDPYRLEFIGDELVQMRLFDVATQRSRGPVSELQLTPGQELSLLESGAELCTLLDYLPSNALILLDDLLALEDRYVSLKSFPGAFSRTFQTMEEFFQAAEGHQLIFFADRPIDQLSEVKLRTEGSQVIASFDALSHHFQAERLGHPFLRVYDFFPLESAAELPPAMLLVQSVLSTTPSIGMHTHWLCSSDHDERQLRSIIDDLGLALPMEDAISLGDLSSGFVLPADHLAVIPTPELTHRIKLRRQHLRSAYHAPMLDFHELRPGDVVVHIQQGIGKFRGVEERVNHQGEPAEFLLLEYADGATLHVPAHQAHLVSRYVGIQEQAPSLHQLGGTKWRRQREATEKAIAGYAQQLLELYASREVRGGFAFRQDGEEMDAFEKAFPYIETEDQTLAIHAVKGDMTASKAMDRLICGDVGYGKTEVAMRAAFKAVMDGGKQVAVLVPTTVLALQHFESFSERMEGSGVRIACLSRMQTPKQQKAVLAQIAAGTIDIVIGTHRIVSKDVQFKDLGLLIIDEEQRFGVKAKEHLRQMRAGVDTLTLSATPIPRTLHFSMLGARDLSIIATPPQDRLPIKTILCEEDDSVIQAALVREFARDGQAYYIHNRVESIYSVAARLQKLVPQARIAIAHGQMDPDALDEVFHRFKSSEANLLIATSIVENGLDIPRANTILIERADMFGLAELYQLRGRVGRWNRKAYAYLLVPKNRRLPEIAQQRLEALLGNNGQGGGLKVAMRDLEIRGAGDILGTEQSGHICTIGYHLYTKLLKRTIDALSGKAPTTWGDARVELPVDARLPNDYVPEAGLRMEFYQRFGEAHSIDQIDELMRELRDRFGSVPKPALWLRVVSAVRIVAAKHGVHSVKWNRGSLTLQVGSGAHMTTQTCRLPLVWNDPDTCLAPLLRALEELAVEPTGPTARAASQPSQTLASKALKKLKSQH